VAGAGDLGGEELEWAVLGGRADWPKNSDGRGAGVGCLGGG
jgi:hypothetical protein